MSCVSGDFSALDPKHGSVAGPPGGSVSACLI